MTTWQGAFVSEKLNLSIEEEKDSVLHLTSLVGLALRDNPKRAHLLVSKVLGKHIPQKPVLIEKSAQILGLMVWEKAHNKTGYASQAAKKLLDTALKNPTKENLHKLSSFVDACETGLTNTVCVGYAETATSLGALVANKLTSYYIHSTRYPDPTIPNYGSFEESHSHATSHFLTAEDVSYLDGLNRSIVLIDDEITTGNTLINTISMLETRTHHPAYYLVSLVDFRTLEDREKLEQLARKLNTRIEVVALFEGAVHVPVDALEIAKPIVEHLKEMKDVELSSSGEAQVVSITVSSSLVPLKNGVDDLGKYVNMGERIAAKVKDSLQGKTLVLGLEEDMFLPLEVAKNLEEQSEDVYFSSTTRSPVVSLNSDEYAIKTALNYVVPPIEGDTDKRYAYNISGSFETIVLVVENPAVLEQISCRGGLIEKLKFLTRKIIIVNLENFPKPLTGPDFGSYKASDVQWLLKDLSNAELEAPIEDREESIQNGGAHYAESLPIEYQPTAEYQQLFLETLNESKEEIAEAIANVSEVIFKERAGQPVIVSLARAGTPIGILIKRYLESVYDVEVPHYAVSIVRGKGIDYVALNYIASLYDPSRVIFVDGWTGKGAITKELEEALNVYAADTGVVFPKDVAVLADPGNCVRIYGTRDDFLIPSACLNSTVSGLVSRTVLNTAFIHEGDYHGAKFYKEFASNDYSNYFVDTISRLFTEQLASEAQAATENYELVAPTWEGWAAIESINTEYGINNINLVKPGVGETTRVLLRRVPWKILIRRDKINQLSHIQLLAAERGVPIELVDSLPYACVGLIHPIYTKGATGFNGGKI